MPNTEQIKSMVRSLLAWIGGIIASWGVVKNWATADQITSLFGSEMLIGAVMWLVSFVWGLITHKETNAVTIVNAIPDVKGVITQPTQAGKELAKAVDAPVSVVPAGTPQAAAVAS